MGIDKEAMDIWVFGRKCPEISVEYTIEATRTFNPEELSPQERRRRDKALSKHKNLRIEELMSTIPSIIEKARTQRNA